MTNTPSSSDTPVLLKLAHIGDTHLLDRQFGKESRGVSIANAVVSLVSHALHVRPHDHLALSGDILNSVRPSPDVVLVLRRLDKMLRDAGKACWCISGNHDFTGQHHWIHASTDQECNMRERRGLIMCDWKHVQIAPGVSLLGIPGVDADEIREKLPMLPDAELVLAHFTPKEHMPFPNERSLSQTELVREKTEAVLLGDYHEPFVDTVRRKDGTEIPVVMPGSPVHCSVAESEDKGYFSITLEGSRVVSIERVQMLSTDVLRIDLSAEPDALERLKKTMAERLPERELLLVVRFDAGTHAIKPVLEIVGDAPNVTLRPMPYISEKERQLVGAEALVEGELRPLHAFQGDFSVGVPSLDNALTALLKRVPDADKLLDKAIDDYRNSDV